MAVKAQDQVTLIDMTDAISIITWYRLQVSTLTRPAKPTTSNASQPPDGWTKTEPAFSEGSTNTLYTCCQNNFGDGTCVYLLGISGAGIDADSQVEKPMRLQVKE